MKVSVLVVSFNHEKYIEECVNGILAQEAPFEWEIVVADDCSTDATVQIARDALRDGDRGCRVLETASRLGMWKNYQRGFKECQGEYIAVVEGDDYWTDPQRIAKHVTFLDLHRECSMSFNRVARFHQDVGRFEVGNWSHQDDFGYVTTGMLAEGNLIGNLSACVARKSAVDRMEPDVYEPGFADWIFGMVMGQFGLLAQQKDVMSVYRVHSCGAWSGLSADEQNESVLRGIDRYNAYLKYTYDAEFARYKAKLLGTRAPQRNVMVAVLRLGRMVLPRRVRRWVREALRGA
jgi:glycosyltransferase involved in cell wall biosynthesis